VTPEPSGPWSAEQAGAFLEHAVIPLRLATSGRAGPTVQSMWFRWDGAGVWCATQSDARVVARLASDPRCGFEVAGDSPPYRGVRGTGTARVLPDQGEPVLRALLQRYLGGETSELARWLLSRVHNEVAVHIIPASWASWDYTSRMST
jgi:nitroimidazol reductase NimA-like FMN-containing flavoprotein (pyridoxamine 5'-phosphate oxidase superfamily)